MNQGDPVLKLILNNLEHLGIDQETFSAVFEGFFDLYCKKPQSADLSTKKMEGWLNKIKMVIPAGSAA